ncbi:U32 family peptidase [Lentimicrobium sp. L6]|uniref:peptidase U32 family protein n=1 Tax=Lentimicrobium sp. L6 TaxID=2735916 RepID=UPI00155303DA|nr:U32 family peptidase [Lentimicrobium sp. L6]NPD86804.1 U32 family peptidase [Lentimicrobium sp. L6]
MKKIELLVPAKNLESGMVAINYGADAVYIGADRFGARAAASNTVKDIEELVTYAHKYNAKVFVTLNTILFDKELEEAEKLIHEIYDAGADALIIQDMGILKMNLPPIPLHASTQTNNYDLERIQFLDDLGFERIVLARELSLEEIRKVKSKTKAELEFFIHGSLCVSLSGQCYFSEAITGRSANRGMCAQMCRHPYNLVDADGKKIVLNSHLLSLKDLNLGKDLKEMIQAGVMSLKIEGRLKDINYVKNVVSFYRQKLDEIFASDNEFTKASSGKTQIQFEPDPEKSFNRLHSDYFLNGRGEELVNKNSPKSMGKKLGRVRLVMSNYITIRTQEELHNGDGLCFIKDGEVLGVRVDKVDGNHFYVSDISKLKSGMEIYRNHDHDFNKKLLADKSVRKVAAKIEITEIEGKLSFILKDEDGLQSDYVLETLPDVANNEERAISNIKTQLAKSGITMFDIEEVIFKSTQAYFFRMSELNEIRRTLFEKHEQHRIKSFVRKDSVMKIQDIPFPKTEVDFTENISNEKARQFYKEHGVIKQEEALEISPEKVDQLLMTTRYCIKHELGYCERFQGAKNTPPEPLYLEDQNRKYKLSFDCKNCLMKIRMVGG